MKGLRFLILLAGMVAAALYFTNPDGSDFTEFVALYVQEQLADEVPGESELGKKFRKGLGQVASLAAGQLARRENFQLCSIYTLDIVGERHVFVGVAGQFFPLKKRKSLR